MKFFLIILMLGCSNVKVSRRPATDSDAHSFRAINQFVDNKINDFLNNGVSEKELSIFYFNLKNKYDNLISFQRQERSYQYDFLQDLEKKHLPMLEDIAQKQNIKLDPIHLQHEIESLKLKVDHVENQLRDVFSKFGKNKKMVERITQFLAFSRSGSLSSGTIGDWNPQSAESIQNSSLNGLRHVLKEIEKRDGKVDLELLKTYHKSLLGNAEHSYSRAGQINEIFFKDDKNNPVHVSWYLESLIEEINNNKSSLNALNAYNQFLHFHPFGDSNGRIAEILKIIKLKEVNLPALITFEKSSLENYYLQNMFGRTLLDDYQNLFYQITETLELLKSLNQLLSQAKVYNVNLIGRKIVIQYIKDNRPQVLVLTKAFQTTESWDQSIEKGSIIVKDTNIEDVKMRYSLDQWKTQKEIAPIVLTSPKRKSKTKAHYIAFSLEEVSTDLNFSFLFHHTQYEEKIWIKNAGQNYQFKFKDFPPYCDSLLSIIL